MVLPLSGERRKNVDLSGIPAYAERPRVGCIMARPSRTPITPQQAWTLVVAVEGTEFSSRPAGENREEAWGRISLALNESAQEAARSYAVVRARRIWGRLGNLLQRSLWCKAWRAANCVPRIILRWVKTWKLVGTSAYHRGGNHPTASTAA